MDGIGGVASSGLPAIGHGAACVPTARRTRYGGNAVSSDRDRAETMPFTPQLKFDDTAASQAKAPPRVFRFAYDNHDRESSLLGALRNRAGSRAEAWATRQAWLWPRASDRESEGASL